MRKNPRYCAEFKQGAVSQVTKEGHAVMEVFRRLGISDKTLSRWLKELSTPIDKRAVQSDLQSEVTRLKRELKRAQQERDILKEAAVDSTCQRNTLFY